MQASSNETPPQILTREDGATIAYHFTPGQDLPQNTPESTHNRIGVVFLSGYKSDMQGSKALALEAWCQAHGRSFLRFDYTGHGQSSGAFIDGTIGQWANDAIYALDHLTQGPQVLVGSSMGGWLMLLVARERAERLRGLIGLAAAPDFTEDLMANAFTDAQRLELEQTGQVALPSDYNPQDPYIITKALIEDGKTHLVLREPLNLKMPVRLIQGMKDLDVPWQTALQIQDALVSDDVEIQFVKNGDHRLSEEADLKRLTRTLNNLLSDLESEPV
ncbi:alpha/beta hydrolase [Magnetovibrio blakemorei]|uniref:Alpha/beta hydrolase n=1 Tax=Magnetovibrio blakemorei TaxID=28181 RepID=A0A1E5Q8P5_9PROT|nr:alpha/beta hydrolase [Magnetovibrio blakemorei]OEJ67759.1 alpha/beta hydrolase [Magnetovibrio blakemorei]